MKFFLLIGIHVLILSCSENQQKTESCDISDETEFNRVEVIRVGGSSLNDEIGIIKNDSSIILLTSNKYRDAGPILSFDNKYVLFSRMEIFNGFLIDDKCEYSLVLMNVNTKHEKVLVSSIKELTSISWSPNSLKFCYTSLNNGKYMMKIFDVISNTNREVCDDATCAIWSAEGSKIAYYTTSGKVGLHDVVTAENIILYEDLKSTSSVGLCWTNTNTLVFPKESSWVSISDDLENVQYIKERPEILDQRKFGWRKTNRVGPKDCTQRGGEMGVLEE